MKATMKKVTIECLKWNGVNFADIEAFCGKGVARIAPCMQTGDNELFIKTLEGAHMARVGDYIIKGVKGEFYPCKPDIFAQTYDIVDGDSRVREFVETRHDLLTTKYTKVLEESEYQYNAPHTFKVIRAQEENSEAHKGENLVLSCIHFQEGPIKKCGVNGVSNEDLLVMVVRRLEGFQNSEFKCRENACAITKIEEALLWLRKRTMGRENRGVEGTNKV